MSGNRSIQEILFFNNVSTTSDSESYLITSDASTMNLDIFGTGTFNAVIEGKVSSIGSYDEIMAYDTKVGTLSTIINTFNTWQIDLTGWSYIRVRLTSVSGTISAVARLVG